MSQVTLKGPVTPAMNITPLIDVVFLLIIFFMLVSNIIAEESVPMIVPQLDDPKTTKLGDDLRRIVVNVAPDPFDPKTRSEGNSLLHSPIANHLRIGLERFDMNDEGIKTATARLKEIVDTGPRQADGSSVYEVLLRADQALSYSEIQPVMTMITAAGIGKVNLVADMPD